jgi:two-component system cell cycle response regulator DivK
MTHILYIEDNYHNYRLVMRMLSLEKERQFEVTQAIDGTTGLQLATKIQPDLILMDINLPDIDGVAVTSKLKSDPGLQHIPIIALTANAMVGDRERFLDAGCDGYLRKPISRSELREVVNKFLNNNNHQ